MRKEDQILTICSRQNFQGTHKRKLLDICNNENIRWDIVYLTAMLHGIAPLIYHNLKKCGSEIPCIPKETMNRFLYSTIENITGKEHSTEKIKEVLTFCNKQNINVMLIKGAALDLFVYDHPWYMMNADIDLMVKHRNGSISDEKKKNVQELTRSLGIECDYFGHHDVDIGSLLPIDFHKIWNKALKIKYGDQDAFVMSPEDTLLCVCINSCRKRYFRLKSLCDIAEVVNYYKNLKWEELIRNAIDYDCNKIVYTALLATKMILGCELPDGMLEKFAVNPTRRRIILYLIHHLIRKRALLSAFPNYKVFNSDVAIINRKVDIQLILTYSTYSWSQLCRKPLHILRKMIHLREQA